MNIIPKAKPIRFTIVSGGEECSSLEMLRNNFRISDVVKSKNRLVRWLKQVGENDLCNKISSLSSDDDEMKFMIEVAKMLYYREDMDSDNYAITIRMLKDNILSIKNRCVQEMLEKNVDFVISSYWNGVLHDPINIVGKHLHTENGDILYIYGVEMTKRDGIPNLIKGHEYILQAAEKKNSYALEYESSGLFNKELHSRRNISPFVREISKRLGEASTIKEAESQLEELKTYVTENGSQGDACVLGFATILYAKKRLVDEDFCQQVDDILTSYVNRVCNKCRMILKTKESSIFSERSCKTNIEILGDTLYLFEYKRPRVSYPHMTIFDGLGVSSPHMIKYFDGLETYNEKFKEGYNYIKKRLDKI